MHLVIGVILALVFWWLWIPLVVFFGACWIVTLIVDRLRFNDLTPEGKNVYREELAASEQQARERRKEWEAAMRNRAREIVLQKRMAVAHQEAHRQERNSQLQGQLFSAGTKIATSVAVAALTGGKHRHRH